MADDFECPQSKRLGRHDKQGWLAYATFALAAGGIVYSAGIQANQIDNNTKDISELSENDKRSESDRRTIDARLNRIEAKLDLMLQDKGIRFSAN